MADKGARPDRDAGMKLQWPQDRLSAGSDVRTARGRRRALEGGTDEVTVDSLQALLEEYAQEIVAAVEGVTGETSGTLLTQIRRLSDAVDTMSAQVTQLATDVVALRRRISLQSKTAGVSDEQLEAITDAVVAALDEKKGRRRRR